MVFKKGDIVIFKDDTISTQKFIIYDINPGSDNWGKHFTLLDYNKPEDFMTSGWENYLKLDKAYTRKMKIEKIYERIKT